MTNYTTLIKQLCDPKTAAKRVTIVAISKKQPNSKLAQSYDAGYRHFGESYFDGLERTLTFFKDKSDVFIHFVGPIQSNKIKHLCRSDIELVHSVGKQSHLDKFLAYQTSGAPIPNMLLQVNATQDPNQQGLASNTLQTLLEQFHTLPIVGGMVIGPNPILFSSKDLWSEATTHTFRETMILFRGIQQAHPQFKIFSLGMSQDAKIAIELGATHVRLGTTIFGPRDKT